MNVSQFDGSAAFHGIGFMPPSNAAPEPSFFPSKNREVQTLLSVTLKQIHDAIAGENGFFIDDVDVSTVKLVGVVHEFVGRVTDATFTVDDGTGRIECNRLNGMYVRVHGCLKTFQGKKTIQAFCVRPVDDYDEIASHFIECMYVHLYNTKLSKSQVGAGVTTQSYMTIPQSQVPGQYSLDGQRSLEENVLQVLNYPPYLQGGAHIETIAQVLKVPAQDISSVSRALSNLVEVGRIYEFDKSWYKSLANG
ncbi:replication protein A 32 kDa subunit B isoform X2 [Argentina anserina]|uniref:replication protein A 32 kDa subunit B isoform X2 n=1 Tax=Argentina anserina TaxID=57926 RepID=UPI002176760C|nr:replication protein A 32 kDa subunit B isoform X2 [Potentilla anserina]